MGRSSSTSDNKAAEVDTTRRKVDLVVEAALQHKAHDPVLLDVGRLSSIADFFFICSCRSSRQVQAVADSVIDEVKKHGGFRPLGVEGKTQGQWVLIDYGEVIVHIFYESIREYYDLESLWADAVRIQLNE